MIHVKNTRIRQLSDLKDTILISWMRPFRYALYIACSFVGLILFSGCSKWLDVRPITEVPESMMFENEKGFYEVLAGSYIKMGSTSLYGKEMTMGLLDVMAQRYDVYSSIPTQYVSLMTTLGGYDYQAEAPRMQFINPVWQQLYGIIGNTNNLLENIERKRQVFTGNNYNLVKGQALALRAFLHFDLLRLFAPALNTGDNTPTIPYVTKFQPATSPRQPFSEVIKLCIQDLDEAEELLAVDKSMREIDNDIFLSFTRNKLNYYAVLALKARIYLYNQQTALANQYARMVIRAVPSRLKFITEAGVRGGDRTFVSEHLFSLQVPNLRASYNSLFANSSTILSVDPTILLDEVYERQQSDFRYLYHWRQSSGGNVVLHKFAQTDIPAADSVRYAVQMPLIRLSEAYYIAAETDLNVDTATAYLNTIRANRGLDDPSLRLRNLTAVTLQEEIRKEYRKEFYGEGQLFFYYKRRRMPAIPNIYGDAISAPARIYTWPIPLEELLGR